MSKKAIIAILVILVLLTVGNVLWTMKNYRNDNDFNDSESSSESLEETESSTEDGIIFETVQSTEETSEEQSSQDVTPSIDQNLRELSRITTQAGRVIIFYVCDDYVTPKGHVNLRTEPSTQQGNETVKVQVTNGTAVHRIGISNDTGWSCVEYNGEILYVISSYVSVTEYEEPETSTSDLSDMEETTELGTETNSTEESQIESSTVESSTVETSVEESSVEES